ncbi:MAG: NiFe hydrogenase, large subunit [Candidatus Fermentimicrarchaeum limneticum]|uniref:NiFe hydrogenase, large subunit n=1 Tax=Fermentimicrarchaeum limneticum TaxID=2795018 RepID=A0A7D6BFX8_FERL1|nr:MAG: NiFe hydrogenase, large subunit [Candidatus Fermentimicrarchaeum limneticum]
MHDSKLVIGPSHPMLVEPARLVFGIKDGRIKSVDIDLGYTHKGIEKMLETKNYTQAVPFVERICGICSHCHASNFCYAVEKLSGIEIPERAKYIRTIAAELERVHSHLLVLSLTMEDIGQRKLMLETLDRRERIVDAFEEFTGGRVHHSINVIGGTRLDIDKDAAGMIRTAVDEATEYSKKLAETILKNDSVRKQLEGNGVLSREKAKQLGVVGPVGRGSGIDYDVRKAKSYGKYSEMDFSIPLHDEGDSLARTLVRVEEIPESARIIKECFSRMQPGELRVRWDGKPPAGEQIHLVEAPRGENLHYVISRGERTPYRVRIRPPSFANLQCAATILEGASVSDIPAAVISLDPCISCTERTAYIDRGGIVYVEYRG